MLSLDSWLQLKPTSPQPSPPAGDNLPLLQPVLINLFQFLLILYVIGGYHGGFLWLNHLGEALPDRLWANITLLGDTRVALVLLLMFVFAQPKLLTKMVFATLFTTILIQGLKQHLEISRPAAVLPADSFHIIGETLSMNSFPSGHSATIGVVITLLLTITHSSRLARWLIFAMFVVGLSRTMVGAHWPVDILTGLLLGSLCALLAHWLTEAHFPDMWPPLQWLAVGLITVSALTIFSDDGHYPQGQIFAILLTLIASIRYACQLAKSLPEQYRDLKSKESHATAD